MDWYEALILGIIQGLTEFLPVSSSGHLELGKVILNTEIKEDITFAMVVHAATVLSILVVFFQELKTLVVESFSFKWNTSHSYLLKLLISMVPVAIVGIFFRDQVEQFFTGNIVLVGSMLLITAGLLTLSYFSKDRNKEITYLHSLIIGIAQALAVLPGISRSGATISTGLLLGNRRGDVAKFSFLMVLLPIIAANLLDLSSGEFSSGASISPISLIIGFIAAFLSGLLACKWMLSIVRKGKLIYFGIYCLVIGIIAIIVGA
ncbi:MAG: undecaprenyl-diphosphate phosphatase [Bacteroidales bacterium]|nr:undecaprenyl-diphosphate phosphatase [Bacteroidales bacterium]